MTQTIYIGQGSRFGISKAGDYLTILDPDGHELAELAFISPEAALKFATAARLALTRIENHAASRYGQLLADAHENEGAF
jgi:hypothetical protein